MPMLHSGKDLQCECSHHVATRNNLGGEILIQIPLEAPEPPGLFPDGWARELTRYVHVVREQVGAVYSVDNDLRRRVDRICDKPEEYSAIHEGRRSRRRQNRH